MKDWPRKTQEGTKSIQIAYRAFLCFSWLIIVIVETQVFVWSTGEVKWIHQHIQRVCYVMNFNFYCTSLNPREFDFPHQLRSHLDDSDPRLQGHIGEVVAFLTQNGQREMTVHLYRIYCHMKRIHHYFSIAAEPDQLDSVAQWAHDANALLILDDRSVRGPTGNILIGPDGKIDESGQVPFPADAIQRKLKNESWLSEQQIPFNNNLPPVVGEDEVLFRAPKEVACRALSLLICALKAESLATGEDFSELKAALQKRMPMGFESFSPVERNFMDDENPDQQTVINFGYRYECVYVLLWSLGLFERLDPPTSICDVPKVSRTMFEQDIAEFVGNAKLCDTKNLLDELDLHFRFLWTAREEKFGSSDISSSLDLGVVQERCITLNWLTNYEKADWDDVDCPS